MQAQLYLNQYSFSKLIDFVNKTSLASRNTKDPSIRPLAKYSDANVCYNATKIKDNVRAWNNANDNFVGEAMYRGLDCGIKDSDKNIISSISSKVLEKERVRARSRLSVSLRDD